ncbi:MAG TPA: hypothetical protein VD794_10115 [Flavisolibacter sp.]|nr:hypothetical protein [Flavisolibacter sp.]
MKERLEQFINTNRDAFDNEIPPSHIWEQVNKKLVHEKKQTKTFLLAHVKLWAAVIGFLVAGIVIFLIVENNNLKNDLTASRHRLEQQHKLHLEQITDYNKEISQFTQIVAVKQNQLSGFSKEYPSLYKSFTSDINDLNKEYEKLKQELKIVPEQDEILDAMIQNLKLQTELLNEQLLIIHQLKSTKKNTNEKATAII